MTRPDRELISQSAARQLLERAGQIDVDTTSVETLRAAAREAGISEAAFDAALAEMRSQGAMAPPPVPLSPPRRTKALALGAASAVFVATMLMTLLIGRGRQQGAVMESSIEVRCIPMRTAQDIAQRLMTDPGAEVQMSAGSTRLRVRGSPNMVGLVHQAINDAARDAKVCVNPLESGR
jgi:hypothetical protein